MDSLPPERNLPLRRREDMDDFQKFQVTASPEETLLFVSQQYHPAWRRRRINGRCGRCWSIGSIKASSFLR